MKESSIGPGLIHRKTEQGGQEETGVLEEKRERAKKRGKEMVDGG